MFIVVSEPTGLSVRSFGPYIVRELAEVAAECARATLGGPATVIPLELPSALAAASEFEAAIDQLIGNGLLQDARRADAQIIPLRNRTAATVHPATADQPSEA